MKSNYSYVNVFQGSGKTVLPKPEGIASKWLFIKAQCGNTSPAAAYPFGKMTVGAYTGGYPTGYGNLSPNSCGSPPEFEARVHGFSHMHVSGTGGIRAYYNYAVTSPIVGNSLCALNDKIVSEDAVPGYYRAELSSGVIFEGTVSQRLAYHRYLFQDKGILQIDFSNDGLIRNWKGFFCLPEYAKIDIVSQTRVTAHVKTHGIDLYFAAECPSSHDVFLWQDYKEIKDTQMELSNSSLRFGAAFNVCGVSELKLAISFVSCSSAIAVLDSEQEGFETVKDKTQAAWEEYLSKIDIETENDNLREIFYSNLYHSLIKPCNGCGESFLYDANKAGGDFYFDFATLWDMYKTELPLIFTLYKDEAEGIVKTLLQLTKRLGHSPINVTIAADNDFSDQARMLAEHSFADFYFRYGDKYADLMLEASDIDVNAQKDFLESRYCPRYTHILDICEALGAMSQIAHERGKKEIAERYEALSDKWINAFDKSTGLMSTNSPYYEGTNKNYSFRLLRNMDERIALMGKDRFVSELDDFFGFYRDPVERPTDPSKDPLELGINSFEGFNNESDMEAPYAYIYAGRHDRTCEILRAGMKYMFTSDKGGLPGNNDSGGLSSCYVWNAIGLFPVSGQDLMLIGTPIVDGATLELSNGKKLSIAVHNNSDNNIYVRRVVFNGKEIADYRMTVRDLMSGGMLEFYMQI